MNPSDKIPGAENFTWKEALWLPTWNRLAEESDGLNEDIKVNLIKTFGWMQKVREFLGKPISVHVAYRPSAYNLQIGGAAKSQHTLGNAVDFSVKGMTCEEVRQVLLPKLEEWNLRMEDIQGNWIHLDDRIPGPGGRFFKP